MVLRFGEIAKRLTGISTPILGVSWSPPPSEVAVARRVLHFLEDRRVLFSPYEAELPDHCVASALEMRRFFTGALEAANEGGELAAHLRAMRAACRKFVDTV